MFKSMPKTASWSSASSQNRFGDFPRACFFVRKTPVRVGEIALKHYRNGIHSISTFKMICQEAFCAHFFVREMPLDF